MISKSYEGFTNEMRKIERGRVIQCKPFAKLYEFIVQDGYLVGQMLQKISLLQIIQIDCFIVNVFVHQFLALIVDSLHLSKIVT